VVRAIAPHSVVRVMQKSAVPSASMSTTKAKDRSAALARLRSLLDEHKIAAYIIPTADAHQVTFAWSLCHSQKKP
jgi:hypothetical protein